MRRDVKLGISIYPENQNINEIKEYVKLASEYGYTRIFTSILQVTKDNKDEMISKFKEVLGYCNELGFEIVLDVAPNVFDILEINLPNIDLFKEMYVDTIRLDEKLGDGLESQILKENPKIELELNVSTSIEDLDEILNDCEDRSRIKTSHNFYPQRYTGLPLKHLIKHSEHCKEAGLRVQAFINSHGEKAVTGPWNVNEGLCTLEEHRNLDAFVQAQLLATLDCIDDISFGNSFASEKELRMVSKVKEDYIYLKIKTNEISEIESEIIFNYGNHFRRPDINDYSIRLTMARVDYKDSIINPSNVIPDVQTFGEVYILNQDFDRYKGEVQIITLEMPKDKRKNLIGIVNEDYQKLIPFIGSRQKIKFIK